MPRYVAFVRGINLGKRRVAMGRLRGLFEELGFDDVATFIASGNVIFSSTARNAGALEKRIAKHLHEALGYEVDTFVRTAEEVAAIAGRKPFAEDGQPGMTIHVALLHEKLPAAAAKKLAAVRTDYDAFLVSGREFYWLCRGPMSRSKVWTLPEVKSLRLPTMTMRRLTSLRKLVGKLVR
jgi:uncharacterized protein (DUF1697 family)